MADFLTDAEVMGGAPPGGLVINMTHRGGQGESRTFLSDEEIMGKARPAPVEADARKEVPTAIRPAVGFNRTVADMAGAPVDAATWMINHSPGSFLVNKGAEALGFQAPIPGIKDPLGGSASIKRSMGALPFGGANPDDVRSANTPTERVLEGAGSGAAAMMVPGLGAEATLARVGRESEALGKMMTDIIRGSGVASNTVIGAAGGAAGEGVAEAIPADASLSVGPLNFSARALKDVGRLGGNLAGGGVAAGVTGGLEAAVRAVGRAARAATEPAELRAAGDILARADQPQKFRTDVAEAAEADQLVPGSSPTTFQATGDLGVGGLEREVAASPKGVPRFAAARQEQNAARLAELENLQKSLPENADPSAVVAAVQKRVQELEQTYGERVTAARNELDARFQSGQLNEAEYGAALREAPIRLRTQLEQTEDALWAAVDPDRVAPFNPGNLKAGVEAIEGAIPRTAKAAEGEERALFDVIKGLDETTTFGDITALRSRLTDELRESTNSPTVRRRISLMLGEVGNALGEAGAASPDVLGRYAAARAATRDVKTRFGEGNVGAVLKEGDRDGFRMTASNVAKNIFDRPEDLRTYLVAVGDDAAARASLQDYAAFSLRKAAMKDGMLSPPKYEKWIADHDYVLKEFPELRQKFADVRQAQGVLDDALASQKQALADYQTGAVKRLLNTQDPDLVITNALKRPGEFEALVKEVKTGGPNQAVWASKDNDIPIQINEAAGQTRGADGRMYQEVAHEGRTSYVPADEIKMVGGSDDAAVAGMKRAVIDFMMKQARSTAEAGTSGESQINAATLQKFFINNKRSLSSLFDPEELASIENVTKDLQRANRSIAAVRIPGGSNTAQDQQGGMMSVMRHMIAQYGAKAGGAGAGFAVAGPVGGPIGFVAGAVADAMRVARVNSIESALVEMMLDPKMAAIWLKQVPSTGGEATASSFARQLKALTAAQVTEAMDRESKRGEP